jgi:hypothetical protein
MVGSAKTIQISRGSMMAVELRVSFVQIHSATKMQMLFLNLFATAAQRNDLAVSSHGLDRRPASLIWGSPFRRNIFGASGLGKFFLVSVQPPNLFHSVFY